VRRIEVLVELPTPLVAMFEALDGDLGQLLGEALELGLSKEARPPEVPAADAADAAVRQEHARRNLLHFFGEYWYLALQVAQLQRDVNRLERELDSLTGSHAGSSVIEQAKQDFVAPTLVELRVRTAPSVVDQAHRIFTKDPTSDPAATAITFGAGLILLRRLLDTASTREIRDEIARYSTRAATLHYRAYVLGHDRQVLEFRLAAQRAQARLRASQ
jgi:hypothetical protein